MKDKYIYKLVNVFLTKATILLVALVVIQLITIILFENNAVEKSEQKNSKVENSKEEDLKEKKSSCIFFIIDNIGWLVIMVFSYPIIFLLYLWVNKNKKCINDSQEENEDLRKVNLEIDGLKKDVDYLKTMIRTKKYENNDKDNNGINVSVNVNKRDY